MKQKETSLVSEKVIARKMRAFVDDSSQGMFSRILFIAQAFL